MTSSGQRLQVVKVGGSLFELADFRMRLQAFLAEQESSNQILIPGGGRMADLVRDWDDRFQLGEQTAHWLALRAMSFNAHLLAALLPNGQVIRRPDELHTALRTGRLPILDAYAWAERDEQSLEHLPHCWEVTSDSVAARVALTAGAAELILLKSVDWPEEGHWDQAAAAGVVDRHFPRLCSMAGKLRIRVLNLRKRVQMPAAEAP